MTGHGDLAGVPAERDRLAAQVVLADRGLGVVQDLLEAGLADIQKRRPGEVGGGHLGRRGAGEHGVLLSRPGGRGRCRWTDQVPASATASPARAWMSSVAAGSGQGAGACAVRAPAPAGAGVCGAGLLARWARARRQAVTPLPVSTPRPSGNAVARACRAA